ncbi:hypothetical protein [Kingella potus]|uniref:hypothetical protein n=1 Tax=Kingella potus TaxID=265175 RepID=UPI001FD1BB4B|nr:hypothetical protein [Kingella potus]UOP01259.1 hypothetical protein LVJ84_03075 [Kingella potus]
MPTHPIRIADVGCVAPRRTRSLPQLKSPQRRGRLKTANGILHTRNQDFQTAFSPFCKLSAVQAVA